MHCKKQWFQLYVRRQKFGYFGHWLSDKNTFEVKNFNTQSSYMQYFQLQTKNFNEPPKCWILILAGCKYICGPAKFHLQPCQTYVWPAKWVIINLSYIISLWIAQFLPKVRCSIWIKPVKVTIFYPDIKVQKYFAWFKIFDNISWKVRQTLFGGIFSGGIFFFNRQKHDWCGRWIFRIANDCQMTEYLIDIIYVRFVGIVICLTARFPVGTNCNICLLIFLCIHTT